MIIEDRRFNAILSRGDVEDIENVYIHNRLSHEQKDKAVNSGIGLLKLIQHQYLSDRQKEGIYEQLTSEEKRELRSMRHNPKEATMKRKLRSIISRTIDDLGVKYKIVGNKYPLIHYPKGFKGAFEDAGFKVRKVRDDEYDEMFDVQNDNTFNYDGNVDSDANYGLDKDGRIFVFREHLGGDIRGDYSDLYKIEYTADTDVEDISAILLPDIIFIYEVGDSKYMDCTLFPGGGTECFDDDGSSSSEKLGIEELFDDYKKSIKRIK